MPKKKFWSFKPKDDDTADLLLYGEISDFSWWGDEVTPKEFKAELDGLGDVSEINVYINSPGGDVFAGQAIHSMLKRHKAKVTAYIDGLAASIASVIAMAADKIIIPRNAMMMVHNPWTIAMGNAEEFRKLADDLEKIGESIIIAYQDKSGMKKEEIIKLLNAETWLPAEEAVSYGLADEIEESKQVAASLKGKVLIFNGQEMDLSRYRNPPKMVINSPIEEEKHNNEDQQTDNNGLFSLFERQIQINKNLIGGN